MHAHTCTHRLHAHICTCACTHTSLKRRLTSPAYFTLPHLASPRLTSPHHTLPYLTLPYSARRQASPCPPSTPTRSSCTTRTRGRSSTTCEPWVTHTRCSTAPPAVKRRCSPPPPPTERCTPTPRPALALALTLAERSSTACESPMARRWWKSVHLGVWEAAASATLAAPQPPSAACAACAARCDCVAQPGAGKVSPRRPGRHQELWRQEGALNVLPHASG